MWKLFKKKRIFKKKPQKLRISIALRRWALPGQPWKVGPDNSCSPIPVQAIGARTCCYPRPESWTSPGLPTNKGGRFTLSSISSFVPASQVSPGHPPRSERQLHAKCKSEAAASLPVASKSPAPSQKRQQDPAQAALITQWPACLPVSTCLSCHFTKNQVARKGEPPWQIGKCEFKAAASDKREIQRHMLIQPSQ